MVSTRQRGNIRENRLARMLEGRRYWCFVSRGSRGIDLVGIPDVGPILCFEVGGSSKSVMGSFDELRKAKRPLGSHCLVARWLKPRGSLGHFRFHADEDYWFDDLDEALDFLKER